MSMIPAPLINGQRYDFSSGKFDIAGVKFAEGIKAVSYSEEGKPGKARGARPAVAGMTRGEYDVSGSLEIYKEYLDEFLKALTSQGRGYLEQMFVGTFAYAEYGMPLTVDVLIGMKLTKLDDSHSEGGDPLVVKADFVAIEMTRNGRRPYAIR